MAGIREQPLGQGSESQMVFAENQRSMKKPLVDFMAGIRGNKVTFDPNHIVLTDGTPSANEILISCLAEQGEAFLLPTPYYPGFDRDFKSPTGIEIVHIKCTSSNNFQITEAALQLAYREAEERNLRVKGVLATNPLGTAMSRNELNLLIDFISDKDMHLISIEIYPGYVFSSPGIASVMEILKENSSLKDQVWDRVHLVYGFSEDLGLPVGAIYSNDGTVVDAATKISSFGLVSSQTQHFLPATLSGRKFTRNYIIQNEKMHKRRQRMLISGLQEAGISCLESNAGSFCWVDMSHLLQSNTFEAEMELLEILYDVELNISSGSYCHCTEPGWFIVRFANMSEQTLELAMKQLKAFVVELSSSNGCSQSRAQFSSGISKRKSLPKPKKVAKALALGLKFSLLIANLVVELL